MSVVANAITLAKEYIAILDEVYASESLTSILTVNPMRVRPTGRAGSFEIQKLSLVGAGDYSRSTGHPAGDTTLTWEEKTYTQDRGRYFTLDAMDAEEAMIGATTIASEFMRVKMVPEIDAYRFATLATAAGKDVTGAIGDSTGAIAAWDTALAALGNAHVPQNRVVGFMSWNMYTRLKNSAAVTRFATMTDQGINRNFETFDGVPIVKVPLDEFYMGITLNAGSDASAGGFTSTGAAINFILLDKDAVFCDVKHGKQRLFDPDTNQLADAWRLDYRVYHDAFLFDNHAAGVYVHAVS